MIVCRINFRGELMEFRAPHGSILFEANPNPLLIFDYETLEIVDGNKAALEMYGYSKEEFSGLKITQIRPKEDLEILEKHINDEGRMLKGSDFRHQTKDGKIFYVSVNSHNLDITGRKLRLVSIHDITPEIEAKKEAREAYRELNAHINNSPLAMVKWDKEFKIIYWSDNAEKLTGFFRAEMIGKTPMDFDYVSPQDKNIITSRMEELVKGKKENDQLETRILNAKGEPIEIKLYTSILRNQKGDIRSVLTLVEDLTEKKKTEKLLKREQLFQQGVLENLKTGVVACDSDKNLTLFNQAARNFHRLEESDGLPPNIDATYFAIGKDGSLSELKPDEIPIYKAMEGEQIRDFEIMIKYKDNTCRTLLANSGPIIDTKNNITGAVVALHDITDRKKYEEQINESLEEKKILLSEIHHRVKNNLAVVSGFLELQIFDTDDDRLRNILRQNQMRILSIAKVHEVLYKNEDFANLSFVDYLEHLLEHISAIINNDNIDIRTFSDIADLKINLNQAVPVALIINEVITNAIEHAYINGEHGIIEVTVSYQKENLQITVEDNGKGLPESCSMENNESLGITLINTLAEQLDADVHYKRKSNGEPGTRFRLSFAPMEKNGSCSNYDINKIAYS